MQYPSLQQLLEAGVHFGHQTRRGNPRMRPYIYGARDGVHIIDLTLSEKMLKEAAEYVKDLTQKGGNVLFVGTKKQASPIIKELAEKTHSPYMASRWIGGFLTNFSEIQKNIKKLKELKEAKQTGALSKYTKKEQLLLDRRMSQLERDLGGVADLDRVPDAMFVIDCVKEDTAVREANRQGIKLVAISDSNSDPSLVDFPIPGNDDAIKSIKILSQTIASAIEEGQASFTKEKLDKETAHKKAAELEEKKAREAAEFLPKAVIEEVAEAEEKVEQEEIKEAKREE